MICPDKITTQEWLSTIEAAHRVGLSTTSTLMFGHLEAPGAVARHSAYIAPNVVLMPSFVNIGADRKSVV